MRKIWNVLRDWVYLILVLTVIIAGFAFVLWSISQ